MPAIPLDDVAARVAAWHNRHPLARRIQPSQVHSIGEVTLPFASDRPQARMDRRATDALAPDAVVDTADAASGDPAQGSSESGRADAETHVQAAGPVDGPTAATSAPSETPVAAPPEQVVLDPAADASAEPTAAAEVGTDGDGTAEAAEPEGLDPQAGAAPADPAAPSQAAEPPPDATDPPPTEAAEAERSEAAAAAAAAAAAVAAVAAEADAAPPDAAAAAESAAVASSVDTPAAEAEAEAEASAEANAIADFRAGSDEAEDDLFDLPATPAAATAEPFAPDSAAAAEPPEAADAADEPASTPTAQDLAEDLFDAAAESTADDSAQAPPAADASPEASETDTPAPPAANGEPASTTPTPESEDPPEAAARSAQAEAEAAFESATADAPAPAAEPQAADTVDTDTDGGAESEPAPPEVDTATAAEATREAELAPQAPVSDGNPDLGDGEGADPSATAAPAKPDNPPLGVTEAASGEAPAAAGSLAARLQAAKRAALGEEAPPQAQAKVQTPPQPRGDDPTDPLAPTTRQALDDRPGEAPADAGAAAFGRALDAGAGDDPEAPLDGGLGDAPAAAGGLVVAPGPLALGPRPAAGAGELDDITELRVPNRWWRRLLARWFGMPVPAGQAIDGLAVGHAGPLTPLFGGDFLWPVSAQRLAQWARRHGTVARLDADGRHRAIAAEPPLLGQARKGGQRFTLALHARTAAIGVDDRRRRVLIGPDGDVLGARALDPRRVGAAAGLGALAIALIAWPAAHPPGGPSEADGAVLAQADRPEPEAHAQHAEGGGHGDSAPAAASPATQGNTQAADDPHRAPSHEANAAATEGSTAPEAPHGTAHADPADPGPAANTAERATGDPPHGATTGTHTTGSVAKADAEPQAPTERPFTTTTPPPRFPQRRADGPVAQIRPSLSPEDQAAAKAQSEQARTAYAQEQASRRSADGSAASAGSNTPSPSDPDAGERRYAVVVTGGQQREPAEAHLAQMLAVRAQLPQVPEHTQVVNQNGLWHAAQWPFNNQADAERARALLASRGLQAQLVPF